MAVELPYGTTGFRYIDEPPIPSSDFWTFDAHCHAAAQVLGGRVLTSDVSAPDETGSLVRATLDLPSGQVSVVRNLHHPVVAFVAPPSTGEEGLRFVEAPALAEVFRRLGGYEILTVSDARNPITEEACQWLGRAERAQFVWRESRCIGDVVFSDWH
jgi:hypothetical protein